MPNNVYSTLVLSGPEDQIHRLLEDSTIERNGKKEIDFSNAYPCPDELKGTGDAEKWCIENWGTKWGTYSVKQIDKNRFEMLTAWSPAEELWLQLSRLYPGVFFATTFRDELLDFYGWANYQDGATLAFGCVEPSSHEEAVIALGGEVSYSEDGGGPMVLSIPKWPAGWEACGRCGG